MWTWKQMNKWRCSFWVSAVAATLPDPHPSPANTPRLSMEEEENGRGRGEDVGGHSASSLSIILFRANFRGRGKRVGGWRRWDVFSEWIFASFHFSSTRLEFFHFSHSPAVTLFLLHHHRLHRRGWGGMARGGGGDKTGQGPLVWRSLPLHY